MRRSELLGQVGDERPRVDAARPNSPGRARRTFTQLAVANPCSDCGVSYCCRSLRLQDVRPREFADFDYLSFLVNFDDIELLVAPDGNWSVLLRRPCRNLDQPTGHCTIHDTAEYPVTCRSYNPYSCFYRKTMSGGDSRSEHVVVDRAALATVLENVRFDEFGHAIDAPGATAIAGWLRAASAGREVEPASASAAAWAPSAGPCSDCPAACCRVLVFPQKRPDCFMDVDRVRYALGFPGVSYLYDADTHALAVSTTCRHLDVATRGCRVFGTPARPKRCEFMNEWKCVMRSTFAFDDGRFVKIRSPEEWQQVESRVVYGRNREITYFPYADADADADAVEGMGSQ